MTLNKKTYKRSSHRRILHRITSKSSGTNKATMGIDSLDHMKVLTRVLSVSSRLDRVYHPFWRKLYRNDAYTLLKTAVLFYKNIQNNRYHAFYSSLINKRLYTGSCPDANKDQRNTFNALTKATPEDLCVLAEHVIRILDSVFTICPHMPMDVTVFRRLWLNNDHELLKMNPGDYYREPGILSTTLNPYYTYVDKWSSTPDDQSFKVLLTLLVPKGSMGYYVNIPFQFDGQAIFDNEFEVVLPRDCVFLVKSKTLFNHRYFITLLLVHQIPPSTALIGVHQPGPKLHVSTANLKSWKIPPAARSLISTARYPEHDWLLRIAKKSYALWLTAPDDMHYIPEKATYVDLNPDKFWVILYFKEGDKPNRAFNLLVAAKPRQVVTIPSRCKIINNGKHLNLHRHLAAGFNFDFRIRDKDDEPFAFYESNPDTPLAVIIEVTNHKPIKQAQQYYMYEYLTSKPLIMTIRNKKSVTLAGGYTYMHVTATRE